MTEEVDTITDEEKALILATVMAPDSSPLPEQSNSEVSQTPEADVD